MGQYSASIQIIRDKDLFLSKLELRAPSSKIKFIIVGDYRKIMQAFHLIMLVLYILI
jgi:hypothetical protein